MTILLATLSILFSTAEAQVTVKNPGVRSMRTEEVTSEGITRHRFIYHSAEYNVDQFLGRETGYLKSELNGASACVIDLLKKLKVGSLAMSADVMALGGSAYLYGRSKEKFEARRIQEIDQNLKKAMEHRLSGLKKELSEVYRKVKLKDLARESNRIEKSIALVERELKQIPQMKNATFHPAAIKRFKTYGEVGLAVGGLFTLLSSALNYGGVFEIESYDYFLMALEYVALENTKIDFEKDSEIVHFKRYLQTILFCLN